MESSKNDQENRFETDVVELSQETENLSLQDKITNSTKLCFSYSKYGHCRFGNNCKFMHRRRKNFSREFIDSKFLNRDFKKIKKLGPSEISASKKTSNSKQPNPPTGDSQKRDISNSPCRYFRAGYCAKDENCNFSHSTENCNTLPPKLHAVSNVKFSTHSRTKKRSVPLCYYFKRGNCHKGDDCKYYHQQRPFVKENLNGTLGHEKINSTSDDVETHDETKLFNTVSKLNGSCSSENNIAACVVPDASIFVNTSINQNMVPLGDCDCPNKTPVCPSDSRNIIPDSCYAVSSKLLPKGESNVPNKAIKIFDLPLSEKEILQFRETEVMQLKKRYPNLEVDVENTVFTFEFTPSDPDWSHDVSNFQLQTVFPENYPVEVCRISVLQSTGVISEIILSHLNESIFDWLNQRHEQCMKANKIELLFRPFLRWFDKSLDELFTSGLQKIKQDIFEGSDDSEYDFSEEQSSSSNESDDPSDLETNQNDSTLVETQDNSKTLEQPTSEMCQLDSSAIIKPGMATYTAQKLGVNILFMGLEFVEGVAAISCTKLAIMLHCARCKTSANLKTVANKNNSLSCSKCSKVMQCNFNPAIVHQFTNIMGTVYLVECQGVDVNLVECAFLVDCLNCSKQVPIQGIHYGPKQKFWCIFCNQKLIISIESSKFQTSGVTYTSVKVAPVKKTEKKKDPSIKEGGPLPQFGACKHYKKSNRWLRFPCCGRVYPCDICHEEKESDHEMKFASRMICGFCSKEQPYRRDKPCSGCSLNVIAKSGAHWEGGKGCRNKVKMAREDKKKYTGTSKTVSKKCQNSGKKKK